MKQTFQPPAGHDAAGPVRSRPAQRQTAAPAGRLTQLAAMMNGGAGMRKLMQLKDDVQQSRRAQDLMGLADEVNQGEPLQRGPAGGDDDGASGDLAQLRLETPGALAHSDRSSVTDTVESDGHPAEQSSCGCSAKADAGPGSESNKLPRGKPVAQKKGAKEMTSGDPYDSALEEIAAPPANRTSLPTQLQSGEQEGREAAPLQFFPAWSRQHDSSLDAFVNNLDNIVNEKAEAVLSDPLGIPDADGYIKNWKKVYRAFAAAYESSGYDLARAKAEAPFIYTAYGYAVESLTNLAINKGDLNSFLPYGAWVSTQATRGHTRPDLVVKDGGDIGWFDITASASETHIDDKTGSGWSTRPYVAEVTYPSLDDQRLLRLVAGGNQHKSSILGGAAIGAVGLGALGAIWGPVGIAAGAVIGGVAGGIAGWQKSRSDARNRQDAMHMALTEQRQERQRKDRALGRIIEDSLSHVSRIGNMADCRREFETDLARRLGLADKLAPRTAKGLLALYQEAGGYSFAYVARQAGYDTAHQGGRNREEALEILYQL